MNGINSTDRTFRFLSNRACMNRGSTIGKNMNYTMSKYDIYHQRCVVEHNYMSLLTSSLLNGTTII